jgi:hypothetical protein
LALAARAGHSLDPLKQLAARILGPDADHALAAFALLQANADHAKVVEAIRALDPMNRGRVYVAAVILRGQDCPADWRMGSQRLLFASERPFLH